MVAVLPAGAHVRHNLARHECMALLRANNWGRLAYTDHALPAITPVSYTLVREAIVYPVMAGTPITEATRNAVVAFEIDHPIEPGTPGWCVVVIGWTSAFSGPHSGTHPQRYFKITPTVVAGRQLFEPDS